MLNNIDLSSFFLTECHSSTNHSLILSYLVCYYFSISSYSALHNFDCLRANKSTSAWGVEARPPFLDADFMQLAMNIDPAEKMITKGDSNRDRLVSIVYLLNC